jgi:hypothetical protein
MTGSTDLLAAAQRLVNVYGAALDHSAKRMLVSDDLLPAPKDQIKTAILTFARAGRSSGTLSSKSIEQLRIGYASLADFVPREQAEVMSTFHDALASVAKLDPNDPKFRESFFESLAPLGNSLPDETMARSKEQFALLLREFDAAMIGPDPGMVGSGSW